MHQQGWLFSIKTSFQSFLFFLEVELFAVSFFNYYFILFNLKVIPDQNLCQKAGHRNEKNFVGARVESGVFFILSSTVFTSD